MDAGPTFYSGAYVERGVNLVSETSHGIVADGSGATNLHTVILEEQSSVAAYYVAIYFFNSTSDQVTLEAGSLVRSFTSIGVSLYR
jgi:hypothetical protein